MMRTWAIAWAIGVVVLICAASFLWAAWAYSIGFNAGLKRIKGGLVAQLGDRVKDKISGLEGLVTGKAEYLYGCKKILMAPETLTKEGDLRNETWIDEDRVEVKRAAVLPIPSSASERAGGPDNEPPKS